MSGAPFDTRTVRPPRSASVWAVLISLRSDENGISPTRLKRAARASATTPGLARGHHQGPLGGVAEHLPPVRLPGSSVALLASTAARSSRSTSARSAGVLERGAPRAAARRRARSPCRVKSVRPPAVIATRTVISFFVRVPVLSEQMTVAEPSACTADSLRMITRRRAIRSVPRESTIVVIAVRPSGTAATARATASSSTDTRAGSVRTCWTSDDGHGHDEGDRDDDPAEEPPHLRQLPLRAASAPRACGSAGRPRPRSRSARRWR